MHPNVQGCFIDSRHDEPVEVLLLGLAVLERDLPMLGQGQPHHRGALDLRADALRIDVETAVDCGVDARYGEASLVIHGDMYDGRNVGQEAAMCSDAAPLAFWQRRAPSGLFRRDFRDTTQPSRV